MKLVIYFDFSKFVKFNEFLKPGTWPHHIILRRDIVGRN